MKVMQINFKYTIPYDQLLKAFDDAAPAFAAVPGLTWKLWLSNKEKSMVAGIYYFKNNADLDKHLASDLHKSLATNPAIADLDVKIFDVMDVSKKTRAPL